MSRGLREFYRNQVVHILVQRFRYRSVMQVPRIVKVVLNMGVGGATKERRLMDGAVADLGAISGQRPLVTRARRSVANFRLRRGAVVGCKVTLRGDRMWGFLERLICIALPRMRDFRGLSRRSFDVRGNYGVGVRELTIFPEVGHDRVGGLDISIGTSARTADEGCALLEALGFPFRTREEDR